MCICRVGNNIRVEAFPYSTRVPSPEIVNRVALEYDQEDVESAEQHHSTHYYPYRDCLTPFYAYSEEKHADACF